MPVEGPEVRGHERGPPRESSEGQRRSQAEQAQGGEAPLKGADYLLETATKEPVSQQPSDHTLQNELLRRLWRV